MLICCYLIQNQKDLQEPNQNFVMKEFMATLFLYQCITDVNIVPNEFLNFEMGIWKFSSLLRCKTLGTYIKNIYVPMTQV